MKYEITKRKVEEVSLGMAAAYWRGRLEGAQVTSPRGECVEAMIEAAARADAPNWECTARILLEG